MNLKISFIGLFISLIALHLSAQERRPEGVIRGTVIDAASGQILPGATVIILDSNPVIGTAVDDRGNFFFDRLPIGRYAVQASCVGYEPAVFREIAVSSAKETFLEIALKEQVNELG
ncbi:MAG: carboxypeptidase-like regulatory domain-containing protein, partial [Dysgonamonadaceae bacterium]|nr:carboxypeptidase-like regulatory domain-containing protein [Dysgonamonadaceae bacterium]